MESQAAVVRTLAGRRAAAGFVVLALALGALFVYKWSGSIGTIAAVRADQAWTRPADAITTGGAIRATAAYFARIWPALALGLVIAAVLRSFVTPDWIATLLGRGGTLRGQISGSLAGVPLMLCSCCVTPIFTTLYGSGARLGPAVAVMLGSPGLNPAALILTFLVFPTSLSFGRLGATLAAVLVLPPLLERLFVHGAPLRSSADRQPEGTLEPLHWSSFIRSFLRSLVQLTITTVPLIVAGVLASSLILPTAVQLSVGTNAIAVVLISAIAVLVALPTFFEIPLALVLMSSGQPGAAAAMLFAGPIINLPSLLILSRQTNVVFAVALAASVWVLAIILGLAVASAA